MLFSIGAFLSVLVGIDVAAQILGNGPLAYIGGLIGAALFFISYKLGASVDAQNDATQAEHDPSHEAHSAPSPAGISDHWSDLEPQDEPDDLSPEPPSESRQGERKHRSSSRRQSRSELAPILDRLKTITKILSS